MSAEYVVLSTGFSPSFEEAGPTHLTRSVGKLTPADLEDILEKMPACTLPSGAANFVPRLEIQTSGKNFTVHLRGGALLLALEGKPVEEAESATPAEIVRAVTGTVSPAKRAKQNAAAAQGAAGRKRTAARLLCAAIVATVLLQVVLIVSGYYSVTDSLAYDEITDGAVLQKLVRDRVGVYANDDPKDGFTLAVCDDGKLRFYDTQKQGGNAPTVYMLFDEAAYVFAKVAGKTAIVVEEAEVMEIGHGGTLVYDERVLTRIDLSPDKLKEIDSTDAEEER